MSEEEVIELRHLKKVVELPCGDRVGTFRGVLIWARKVIPKKNIYEFSIERLEDESSSLSGGFTAWYAEIEGGVLKWISCSLYGSPETNAIKLAAGELEEEDETISY